jgi:hypothetical protein
MVYARQTRQLKSWAEIRAELIALGVITPNALSPASELRAAKQANRLVADAMATIPAQPSRQAGA